MTKQQEITEINKMIVKLQRIKKRHSTSLRGTVTYCNLAIINLDKLIQTLD